MAVIHDIFYNNKLFVLLIKRYTENVFVIGFITCENFLVHPGYPSGGIEQSFAIDVFTDQTQYFTDVTFY
ncbi:hypothetical protein D3C81_2091590 [compost metagenome]